MSLDQASISFPQSLPLRIARDRMDCYERESDRLSSRQDHALDGRDCETLLQLGIDAFDWLMRADTCVRRAVYRGEIDYDPSIDEEITRMLQRWLGPCSFAESVAAAQVLVGIEVSNLDGFRRCVREVRGMLTPDAEYFKSEALAQLRDDALDAHRQGQTGEHGTG